MKIHLHFDKGISLLCFLFVLFTANVKISAQQVRKIISIDKDWKFNPGDVTNGQLAGFDDKKWRKLDVPHDWCIEGKYDSLSPTLRGGGYLPAGIGWYRKTLTLPKSYTGKRIVINFDGVMANSDVWINGHLLGTILLDMSHYGL